MDSEPSKPDFERALRTFFEAAWPEIRRLQMSEGMRVSQAIEEAKLKHAGLWEPCEQALAWTWQIKQDWRKRWGSVPDRLKGSAKQPPTKAEVLAFQKAHELERMYDLTKGDWLGRIRAGLLQPDATPQPTAKEANRKRPRRSAPEPERLTEAKREPMSGPAVRVRDFAAKFEKEHGTPPRYDDMEAELQMSRGTVAGALRELRKAGLWRERPRAGGGTRKRRRKPKRN